MEASEVTLKTLEEYETYQEEIERNKDNQTNISTNTMIDSYNNYVACLSPISFYEMNCKECGFEDKCIYKNKYNYKAIKF